MLTKLHFHPSFYLILLLFSLPSIRLFHLTHAAWFICFKVILFIMCCLLSYIFSSCSPHIVYFLSFIFLSSCTQNLAHKSQCRKHTLTGHAPTMHVHMPSTANAFSGRKDCRLKTGDGYLAYVLRAKLRRGCTFCHNVFSDN